MFPKNWHSNLQREGILDRARVQPQRRPFPYSPRIKEHGEETPRMILKLKQKFQFVAEDDFAK